MNCGTQEILHGFKKYHDSNRRPSVSSTNADRSQFVRFVSYKAGQAVSLLNWFLARISEHKQLI